jgi:hypothetical protein
MKDQARSPRPVNCCRRINADGHRQLIFETPAGQRITLQDGPSSILIEDRNGNAVRLDPGGITINAAVRVTLHASVVEVSAAQFNVNAAMSTFSGIVQADTVIANHALTPGGGNIW